MATRQDIDQGGGHCSQDRARHDDVPIHREIAGQVIERDGDGLGRRTGHDDDKEVFICSRSVSITTNNQWSDQFLDERNGVYSLRFRLTVRRVEPDCPGETARHFVEV